MKEQGRMFDLNEVFSSLNPDEEKRGASSVPDFMPEKEAFPLKAGQEPGLPVLTVTEISFSLKEVVEQTFSRFKVRGEVSSLKQAASGHIYFSLKDTQSVLNAIVWRGGASRASRFLQEGLEVVCTGHMSTFPGRSNYQMIVEEVEPAGEGALLKQLEDLKKKLAAEGLFDASRKKPIPFLPEVIGVVTSPTGAVIRDIMHRLRDRFPRYVLLYPVLVQGEGAARQIARAIEAFNELPAAGKKVSLPDGKQEVIPKPSVLIVARGGGSLEDLWCFNEECVVRAAAASEIPIISAVGHETDTTLIDYVASLRAPTPTGGAEKAVPVRAELVGMLDQLRLRLNDSVRRYFGEKEVLMTSLSRGLPNLSDIVHLAEQRVDEKEERLRQVFKSFLQMKEAKLELSSRLLNTVSYERILEKGFALVTGERGEALSSALRAETEKVLFLRFKDGSVRVVPQKEGGEGASAPLDIVSENGRKADNRRKKAEEIKKTVSSFEKEQKDLKKSAQEAEKPLSEEKTKEEKRIVPDSLTDLSGLMREEKEVPAPCPPQNKDSQDKETELYLGEETVKRNDAFQNQSSKSGKRNSSKKKESGSAEKDKPVQGSLFE